MEERYVDHALGSDTSGTGKSWTKAWRTLAFAVASVAARPGQGAGFVIHCRGGPLAEEVKITGGGVEGNRFKIRVPAGESFAIQGMLGRATYQPMAINHGTTLSGHWRGLIDVAADWVSINDDDDGPVGKLELLDSYGRGFMSVHPQRATGGRYRGLIVKNMTIRGARRQAFSLEGVANAWVKRVTASGGGNFAPFHRPQDTPPLGLNHPGGTSTQDCDDLVLEHFHSFGHWGEGIIISNNTRNWRAYDLRCWNNSHVNIYVHHAGAGALDNFMAYQEDVQPGGGRPDDWASGLFLENEDWRQDWGDPAKLENCNSISFNNGLIYGCRRGMGIGNGNNGQYSFTDISFRHISVFNPKDGRGNSPAIAWLLHDKAPVSGIEVENCLFHLGDVYAGVGYTRTLSNAASKPGKVTYRNNAWSARPSAAVRGPGDVYGDLGLENPDALIADGKFAESVGQFRPKRTSPVLRRGVWRGATLDIVGVKRANPPDIGALQVTVDTGRGRHFRQGLRGGLG